MSVRDDACDAYHKCTDGSECSTCGHLEECHEPGLEPSEMEAVAAVAHFFGGTRGFDEAAKAWKVVADALASRCLPFDWGEHRVSDGECENCGGSFSGIANDKGCSAVEGPATSGSRTIDELRGALDDLLTSIENSHARPSPQNRILLEGAMERAHAKLADMTEDN
jgi:hypothetical protein